ncbi:MULTISPECIES: hypothetical protein [unclassified Streptomyces]|uniref:hypothetical protein n=1 Tax=unclassified Streptomyces TaxID=2593676 RepID=UPI003662DD13
MTFPRLPYEWDGKKPISRADTGTTIRIEGGELVYHRSACGYTPASTTHFLILGTRPTMPRSESSLVDDDGTRWQTGCAYVNAKRIFGEGSDRMVCWPPGAADARDSHPTYMLQLQRRPPASDAQWENYRTPHDVRAVGCSGDPTPFKANTLAELRWYPAEQPRYEWRARIDQYILHWRGRPYWVYPNGRVVPDN